MGENIRYQMDWVSSEKILDEHKHYLITQVYGWVYSEDEKLAVVSKDGKKWQFPGGHPENGEILEQTLKRELQEEMGLDIDHYPYNLSMFGYYVVNEIVNGEASSTYLQTRFIVKINLSSNDIILTPNERDSEDEKDKIKFCQWMSIAEIILIISWLSDSGELSAFKDSLKSL